MNAMHAGEIPRILLTGAAGQLGFELQRSLTPLGEVLALDRAECDLSDGAAIDALLARWQPHLIVNPAAYTAVDRAESEVELAQAVNADAPAAFARWAAQHDALLVHYSTDYVFDGRKSGAYVEDDAPSPLSVYGCTKLAGEDAIRASGCRHLILRTSWVFGAHGGNFLKTMLRLMRSRDALSVVADQVGAPTPASLLADITAQLVMRYRLAADVAQFPYGTYHLAAAGECSWHEYALEIDYWRRLQGDTLGVARDAIAAIPASSYPTPAVRPMNSRLDCGKLQRTFGLQLPVWQAGVAQVMTILNAQVS